MRKSVILLTIFGVGSAPLVAQTPPAQGQVQPAKPLTVKKRVCETAEEDSYSRLGGRKVCRTIEVKVQDPNQPQSKQPQQPAQPQTPPSGR
jgi:hypothetical protein